MKIFQIVNGFCHWCTPFQSLDETKGFPPDCIFVEAPDYVNEQWGYDETAEGDARFVHPEPPEGWAFDDDTGTFYPLDAVPQMLEDAQNAKQNENKACLARFLEEHPLTWIDGKTYGVTMEDQYEINLNLSKYQVMCQAASAAAETGDTVITPVLQWHAQHEACTDWTLEEMTALVLAINDYVYPWFQLMNQYKAAIYAEEDRKVVEKMTFDYRTEEEKAAEEAEKNAETEPEVEESAEPSEEVTEDTTTEEAAE